MRWADERFVKVYVRDTAELVALGWEARSLFWELLRKTDRAGIVSVGRTGIRGLAGLTGFPVDVVERALPILLEDGCVVERPGAYVIRNFLPAQETPQSDKARKQAQRERDRSRAMDEDVSRKVTPGHAPSQIVTPRLEETKLDEDPVSREEPEGPSGDTVPQETLLDVLARMVASGDTWAVKVQDRRAGRHGGYLTEAEKAVLRKKRDEYAAAPRPTVTAADEADTAAIVVAYETARRRILGDKQYAALTADWNDARKILPDLRLLRERRKVAAPLAEIVAHKLETYLRDPKNRGVNFALRWLLDRTEQDDLPRPKAKARGSPEMPLEALPARNTRKVAAPLSAEEQRDLEELKRKLSSGNERKDPKNEFTAE